MHNLNFKTFFIMSQDYVIDDILTTEIEPEVRNTTSQSSTENATTLDTATEERVITNQKNKVETIVLRTGLVALVVILCAIWIVQYAEHLNKKVMNEMEIKPALSKAAEEKNSNITASIPPTNKRENTANTREFQSITPQEKTPVSNPINKNSDSESKTAIKNNTSYYIVVGSFTDEDRANTLIKQLKEEGYNNTQQLPHEGNYRVAIGFKTRKEAIQAKSRIQDTFSDAWVVPI